MKNLVKESLRSGLLNRIGKWALDHPVTREVVLHLLDGEDFDPPGAKLKDVLIGAGIMDENRGMLAANKYQRGFSGKSLAQLEAEKSKATDVVKQLPISDQEKADLLLHFQIIEDEEAGKVSKSARKVTPGDEELPLSDQERADLHFHFKKIEEEEANGRSSAKPSWSSLDPDKTIERARARLVGLNTRRVPVTFIDTPRDNSLVYTVRDGDRFIVTMDNRSLPAKAVGETVVLYGATNEVLLDLGDGDPFGANEAYNRNGELVPSHVRMVGTPWKLVPVQVRMVAAPWIGTPDSDTVSLGQSLYTLVSSIDAPIQLKDFLIVMFANSTIAGDFFANYIASRSGREAHEEAVRAAQKRLQEMELRKPLGRDHGDPGSNQAEVG
jgi:hypothetical protein